MDIFLTAFEFDGNAGHHHAMFRIAVAERSVAVKLCLTGSEDDCLRFVMTTTLTLHVALSCVVDLPPAAALPAALYVAEQLFAELKANGGRADPLINVMTHYAVMLVPEGFVQRHIPQPDDCNLRLEPGLFANDPLNSRE